MSTEEETLASAAASMSLHCEAKANLVSDGDGERTSRCSDEEQVGHQVLDALRMWWRQSATARRTATRRRCENAGTCVTMSAGGSFSAAVTPNGRLRLWGNSLASENGLNVHHGHGCGSSSGEDDAAPFVAVSAGAAHVLALRGDGSVHCRGTDRDSRAPARGVTGPFVAVSAGVAHSLALRDDCTVACWGRNHDGQAPLHGLPGESFVMVAAGGYHSLGLRPDGSLRAWGRNVEGQCEVPTPIFGKFKSIAAGHLHSLALREDGRIFAWGSNATRQATPPEGEFVVIAAGSAFSLALTPAGSVVHFGHENYGCPPADKQRGPYVGISAGAYHALALRADGIVVCWGLNDLQAPPHGVSVDGEHVRACRLGWRFLDRLD